MERNRLNFLLMSIFVIALALLSFALSIAAEFKKSKKKDIRIDGKPCYVPKSEAFGLGIAALVCLSVAHTISNLFICKNFWFGRERSCSSTTASCKSKFSAIAIVSLAVSWISFVIAVVLIAAATSMSRSQPFGEGWLDGECYIVKDGVYIGSGILALVTVGTTFLSATITIRNTQVDLAQKIHAQVE